MAYLVYNYRPGDTFVDIAREFGTTVSEIMKINNISSPFPTKPSQVLQLLGSINIPIKRSGGLTDVEEGDELVPVPVQSRPVQSNYSSEIGFWSQRKCFIIIGGTTWYFPCWPESYTDSHASHMTAQNILGRSEPFQIYQNSGPRTVSVNFRMHREMNHYQPVEDIVAAVQSAVYPMGNGTSNLTGYSYNGRILPEVILQLGDSCYIRGVIDGNVNASWSDTINKNLKYNVVTLDFTVTECTGNPRTSSMVLSYKARGGSK